jgi:hypothetical protein
MSRFLKTALAAAAICLLVEAAQLQAEQEPDLPDLEKTGVVVPWEDFKLILEEIRRPPVVALAAPPVDFAFSQCEVSAVASRDEQHLKLGLAFEVQTLNPDKWVEVPLIPAGVAISSVTMDGAPARLYDRNGSLNVALKGAGRHRFAIEVVAPVQDSRGHRTAQLRFPAAPSVTVDLSIPRGNLEVQFAGAVLQSVQTSAESTRVRAALQQTRNTTVTWFRKVEADEKSSKVFAEMATMVTIGEGALRGATTASFVIHGQGVDTFRFHLPESITVLDVNAHGLSAWEVGTPDAESGRAQLVVNLNFKAQGSYSLQVRFEQLLEGTSAEFDLPDLEVLDVLRERGFITVAAATNVEITPHGTIENAAPIDPAELPQGLIAAAGDTVLYAYKYLKHPVVVPLAVTKHEDVAVKRTIVELASLHTFISSEGKRITSAVYRMKNNRKQYLEVALPDDAVLWGAYRDRLPVKAARREEGAILVPLKKTAVSASGELESFFVQVVYFEPGAGISTLGSRRLFAPQLDVDTLEIRWRIFMPRDKRYFWFSGNLEWEAGVNRIAYLGSAAYNLDNRRDLDKLALVERHGRRVITDGKNEVAVGEVRVSATGEDRRLSQEEVARIEVGKPSAPSYPEDAEAQEEALLERDEARPVPPGRQAGQLVTQVPESSNVAPGTFRDVGGAGGNAQGVLPVRFDLPAEGLRLSFVGRLMTAEDRPLVAMRFMPAAWRLPRLGLFGVVVLTFISTLAAGLIASRGLAGLSGGPRVGLIAAGAVFLMTLYLAAGHRVAFALTCAVALACCYAVWRLRGQQDIVEGF